MKNKILLSLLIIWGSDLFSQVKLPEGVENLNGQPIGVSFILRDKNDVLWQGAGALGTVNNRYNKGLNKFKNNTWSVVYPTGVFTAALEAGNNIYFAAYDGLYTYDGTNFSIDNSLTLNTSILNYKGKIMIGSFGNGLSEKTTSGYSKLSISINGKSYDSIYSLAASGNDLFIGTTDGLIVYNGITFSRFEIPYKNNGNPMYHKYRKAVLSVQKDVDGKVWVLNNNWEDSMECLYFLKNGIFIEARDYYSQQCIGKNMLPWCAKKISLNANGNIIIGTGWGVLKLNNDSIKNYLIHLDDPFNSFNSNWPNNLRNAFYYIAECDNAGNIYCNVGKTGFLKLKPSDYSNKSILYDPYLNYGIIDINDIKSSITNTGINFQAIDDFNPTRNLPVFTVPNISCAKAMFSATIWMGGTASGSGDLHLAAETYRQNGIDFKPGPIDLVTMTNDSAANSFYNRLWKINRQTIDDFKANRNQPFYIIPKEIMDWPAHGTGNFAKNLAPFVDTDNNGKYEPVKGDYPLIKGDQMLWWVFNDLGTHGETKGKELGVEVHGSCYAYYYRDLSLSDTNNIVNRTIFFNYKIINRSGNDYDSFYTGIWNDVDLGNYADDFIGCDTLQNAGFGYNGDNIDEGRYGYGKNPPMIFCKMLNKKMNSFVYYNNNSDPINGNPNTTQDFYSYMRARWQNGSTIKFGGNGVGGSKNTKFMYSGRICDTTAWTENTSSNSPADRRFLMSTSIPVFRKDSVMDLEFAYTLLHDPTIDFLKDGCDKPTETLRRIQNWYDKKSFPSRPYYGLATEHINKDKQTFLIYPNPANTILNLKSDIESADIRSLEIFDTNGKRVYHSDISSLYGPFSASIDIRSFSTGIYVIKINGTKDIYVGKVVKD